MEPSMEVKHLQEIKGRIDSLSVAIESPATSPKQKKTVRIGGITLAPIDGDSTPAVTPREQDSPSRTEGSAKCPARLNEGPSTVKLSPSLPNMQSNLKLSFRLPKLDINEAKAKMTGASQASSTSKSTPHLARSSSLLLTPTVSPMKLVERSRSGFIMDSPMTTSPDSRRPINTWRTGPTNAAGAGSARALQAAGDKSLCLERSTYYERKDTIADVLMEWDYQRKAFIMSPR